MNEVFFYILMAVLPSTVVFLTSYFIFKRFTDNEYNKLNAELKSKNQSITVPLRLQAYERLSMFLERIHPNSLVIRTFKPGMSARLLQAELLKAIRAEFEHNLSQQIYVSPTLWQAVKMSKEETIKIINIASTRISDDANGADLSKVILEMIGKLENTPSDFSLDVLKKEVKKIL